MKKNISIMLEEEQIQWFCDQVREGQFKNISHGIRVAVEKLKDESAKLQVQTKYRLTKKGEGILKEFGLVKEG